MTPHPARRLWQALEPLHDVVYFAPGIRDAGVAVGLKGFWDTYFAFRAAPLGPVGAGAIVATFANFAPAMVERALPSAWARTTPEACLQARAAASAAALRELAVDEETCARAAAVLAPAVTTADATGRALFAANAALPLPTDPVSALWQTATSLREHRGDGHVAVLVAHGITGLQAHALQSANGRFRPEEILGVRGWSEQDWYDAEAVLERRGLLLGGALTDAGRALLDGVERATDELAWSGSLQALDEDAVDEVVTLLTPGVRAAWSSGWLPAHNPTGLTREG